MANDQETARPKTENGHVIEKWAVVESRVETDWGRRRTANAMRWTAA